MPVVGQQFRRVASSISGSLFALAVLHASILVMAIDNLGIPKKLSDFMVDAGILPYLAYFIASILTPRIHTGWNFLLSSLLAAGAVTLGIILVVVAQLQIAPRSALDGVALYFFPVLSPLTFMAAFTLHAALSAFIRLPNPSDDEALIPLCATCGYNLTGNVSGRCPECGEPIQSPDSGTPRPSADARASD